MRRGSGWGVLASTVLVSACGLGSANDDSAVVTVTEPVVAATDTPLADSWEEVDDSAVVTVTEPVVATTVTPLADSWEEVDFQNLPPALADRVWNAVGC